MNTRKLIMGEPKTGPKPTPIFILRDIKIIISLSYSRLFLMFKHLYKCNYVNCILLTRRILLGAKNWPKTCPSKIMRANKIAIMLAYLRKLGMRTGRRRSGEQVRTMEGECAGMVGKGGAGRFGDPGERHSGGRTAGRSGRAKF